ncbi:MAG TPA: autotransporter domain-containing protein [Methylotenera sp.]|nr:autotransporter domain-containing protein [Methylotenera sp.]
MNTHFFHRNTLLHMNVMFALSAMVSITNANADCLPNGDGTQTCSGVSSNADNLLIGPLILNNTGGGITTINNTTTQSNLITVPAVLDGDGNVIINPEFGAIIRSTTNTVGASSTISADGDSPVVINNIGGTIDIITNDATLGPRTFDPSAWTYNEATRELFNNGVKVGYATAISAGGNTPSLTINNAFVDNRILNPVTATTGLSANILGFGEFTASVYTNTQSLTINNTGGIGTVLSFAGASYTAPSVLDGSAYAENIIAGDTVINVSNPPLGSNAGGSFYEVYVVDRNPLLTQAQTHAQTAGNNLAVSYGVTDIGPRNSVINVGEGSNIYNLHLGSGAHVLNVANSEGGHGINNLMVDQTDSEVVNVIGGVATTLYKMHGDRSFTYNSTNQFGPGNITIKDVQGAVNTLNVSGIATNLFDNITANGLGNNTLNLTCSANSGGSCGYGWQNTVTGMTTINLMGLPSVLAGLYSAQDNNILTSSIHLIDTTLSLADFGVLEASNVVVESGSLLKAPGSSAELKNQTMGIITGNLVNNGSVNVGDATLNVSGDSNMNAGSHLSIGIGPNKNGLLNTAGSANFASEAVVDMSVKTSVLVRDGQSFTIANNMAGLPTIANNNSLLQWSLSDVAGSLVATADVRIADSLKSVVSPAAQNATKAFFSYQGSELTTVKLLANLETMPGEEIAPLAERLRPEINDGAIRMVLGNTDKVFGIIDSRLLDTYLAESKLQPNESQSPSIDNLKSSKGFWVQGFGDRGTQEAIKGADGYGVSVAGMAMGMDKVLDADTRMGFALSYARGNLTNSGNTVNNRVDTNSYLATVYGSHNLTDWYMNGAIGLGRNTYDTRREFLGYSATGTHDSWQFSGRLTAGMPIIIDESLAFIPMTSLDYSRIYESANRENKQERVQLLDSSQVAPSPIYVNGVPQYTDVSSPINLAISSRSFDSIRTGLGAKAIYSLQEKDWGAELELHGMYRHEFGDIAQDSKASFVVGSNSFSSLGVKPIRDDFVIGGSVRLTGDDENDQLTLLTSYDANFREKYFGQTMTLNLRYDFDQAPRYLKKAKEKLAQLKAKHAPEQQIAATEQDIAEIQKAMQAELVIDATNPVDAAKQKAIDATINTWAAALSNKNLDVYFNTYATNFETPDGTTRQQWERKRKAEISKETNPAVKISYLRIKPKDNRAVAIFTQTFIAGSQQVSLQKFVDLENKNGRWLIVREDSMVLDL